MQIIMYGVLNVDRFEATNLFSVCYDNHYITYPVVHGALLNIYMANNEDFPLDTSI